MPAAGHENKGNPAMTSLVVCCTVVAESPNKL
jgi:hypothetical protein